MLESASVEINNFVANVLFGEVCIGVSEINKSLSSWQKLYEQTKECLLKWAKPFTINTIYFTKSKENNDNVIEIVDKIVKIIEKDYNQNITIEEISKKVFFSKTYIRRIFKNNMGMTIVEYITDVRMKKAIELLKYGEYKIVEIASLTGYSNPSYFNLTFRKYYGVTPKQYRMNHYNVGDDL